MNEPIKATERYQMQTPIDNENLNVKLCYDTRTSKVVVSKCIDSKKMWLSELSILRTLRPHKHILKLIDSKIENLIYSDKYYLILEYAEKGDLYQYLLRQPHQRFSEKASLNIFKQLSIAIHWCHKNGVVHGDIKLTNIMVKNDFTIVLGDFGLSSYIPKSGKINKFRGTPAFMSPQVVKAGIDGTYYECCPIDVWAGAVVLYVLLFGILPFDDDDDLRMFDLICYQPLKIAENFIISAKLEQLLRQILEKDDRKRISSLQVLTHPCLL